MINLQAFANGLFLVVCTLHQRLTGFVVLAFHFGRIVLDVIDAATAFMHTAARQAADNLFIIHRDLDNVVDNNALIFQGFRLGNGAGKTVQQKTVFAVRLLNPLLNQRNNNIVRYQTTGCHNLFNLFAKLGLGLDRCPKHVTGGNLGNTEAFSNELGLSPLSGAWCA